MTAIESIVTNLMTEIDRIVGQRVEEKLPEMIRALGIREATPQEDLVDAVEVAKMLGRDVSTNMIFRAPENMSTTSPSKN